MSWTKSFKRDSGLYLFMRQQWITATLSAPSANRPWRLSLGTPRPSVSNSSRLIPLLQLISKKYFCWLPKSLLSKMYVICNYAGCWQMKSADFDRMSWSLNAEKTGFLKNSLLTSNNLLVTEFCIYLSDQRHHFRAKILLEVSLWKWNTNTQFFMRSETNCTLRFFIRNPNLNWI